jgi:hypothetical protein
MYRLTLALLCIWMIYAYETEWILLLLYVSEGGMSMRKTVTRFQLFNSQLWCLGMLGYLLTCPYTLTRTELFFQSDRRWERIVIPIVTALCIHIGFIRDLKLYTATLLLGLVLPSTYLVFGMVLLLPTSVTFVFDSRLFLFRVLQCILLSLFYHHSIQE